jgi:rhodanese-related sulfurtransferase
MGGAVSSRIRNYRPWGYVPSITSAALAQNLTSGIPLVMIDVRTGGEWRSGHILGSIHVPIHKLATGLPAIEATHHPSTRVVCICRAAHRSKPAVRLIADRGHFSDIRELEGGMLRWEGKTVIP